MSSIKKNYIFNSLYQILTLAVPLITTPYLTRVIGADGIGVYSYQYTITSYFTMFVLLGLENYGNREIARHCRSKEDLSYTFSSIYCLQLFMGFLVTAAYGVYIVFSGENRLYVLVFGINVIAACLDINWSLYGLELFQSVAIRNVIIKFLTTVGIFLFVKNEADVIRYCMVMLLGNLATQLSTWPIIRKRITLVRPKIRDVFKHLVPNLWLFLTVISVSLYKTVDKVMLGVFDPQKTQVGFYELSERIISIPNMLVVSLGTVMMPRISGMIARKDESYKELILPSLLFTVSLASAMSFGIMGLSQEFVPLFYGEGFELCIRLYLILLPSSLFMSFANVIRTQYILPNCWDKTLMMSGISGNVVNIIINSLLIPSYGAVGAALGTVCAEALVCFYQAVSVRKDLPLKRYLEYILPLVVIGLVMFIVIFNLEIAGAIQSKMVKMIGKIMVGAVVYICGLIGYVFIIKKRGNATDRKIVEFLNGFVPGKH